MSYVAIKASYLTTLMSVRGSSRALVVNLKAATLIGFLAVENDKFHLTLTNIVFAQIETRLIDY